MVLVGDSLDLPEMGKYRTSPAYAMTTQATIARAAALRPEDVSGGTFTISNIGTVGGTYATPLVNPPEASGAALRLGRRGSL